MQSNILTFGRTINNLVLLIGMFENTLGTEHVLVIETVEFNFFAWMLLAELNSALFH